MAGFDPSEADYTNNILEGSNPALSTFLGFDSAEDNVNALNSTINLVYLWDVRVKVQHLRAVVQAIWQRTNN